MNRPLAAGLGLAGLLALLCAQCGTGPTVAAADAKASADAFATVYRVLQHPRCRNCHPAGEAPLVGDAGEVHPQNVQRGADGVGVLAMRCVACHQTQNTAGPHLPPGAPFWRMPPRHQKLVFEGRSAAELARQLADPQQNGGKTPAQLLEHVQHDPLVLWGWNPGEGRAPVDVPFDAFVAAVRAWVAGGCQAPR